MQLLYNSESYVVVQFDVPGEEAAPGETTGRGGFEIVDKTSRKEIYLDGLLAQSFKAGVQAIVDNNPSPEAFDEYIGRFTAMAQQPVVMH